MAQKRNRKNKAVCIQCGAIKDFPWAPCSECGLDPQHDDVAMAKSVYLSLGRFESVTDRQEYEKELDRISEDIRSGRRVHIPQEELERLLAQKRCVEAITRWHLVAYLGRIFMPVFVFLAALWVMYWVLSLP